MKAADHTPQVSACSSYDAEGVQAVSPGLKWPRPQPLDQGVVMDTVETSQMDGSDCNSVAAVLRSIDHTHTHTHTHTVLLPSKM